MAQLDLEPQERLRLFALVCSFAWADTVVQKEERGFVHELVKRFHLPPDEIEQVEAWLQYPPAPEEVDPLDIPRVHRAMFLEAVEGLIASDGVIDPNEYETLQLLKQLL